MACPDGRAIAACGQGGVGDGGEPLYRDRNPSLRFHVEGGRATYLGEIHVEVSEAGGRLTVLDAGERDLALLRKRFPRIRADQIDVALLK